MTSKMSSQATPENLSQKIAFERNQLQNEVAGAIAAIANILEASTDEEQIADYRSVQIHLQQAQNTIGCDD